ncbi:protein kinase [bacterium]|nr:protein kinase [bacterium]
MSAGIEPIDNYQVASFIAGGGSSQVFEVIEPGTNRRLAMKLITNSHPDAKENKASLKAEAAVCKLLDHPNIIHYEGFTNGREFTYMLMEYFRAPTLKVQLKMDQHGVHLRMKKLLEGLSGALQHMHDRGFIHRDIKPENVLMNKVGEVRLIDFSLSVRAKSGLGALFGGKQTIIQGTRTYIAPETIRKRTPVFQTDFYSLGILLYEVLTGKTPFQAPTPNELLQKHISATPPMASEFNPNVTPDMDRLIAKLLSKKPDARGKDMAEVAGELRRVRIFKEEIVEKTENKEDEKPASLLEQMDAAKLDSRLDAKRSELVRNNPELAAHFSEQKRKRDEEAKAKKDKMAAMKIKGAGQGASAAPAPVQPPAAPVMPMMPTMPMMPPQPYPAPYPPQPMYPPGMGQPLPMPPMPGYPQPLPPGMMAPPQPPGFPPVQPPQPLPQAPAFPNAAIPVTIVPQPTKPSPAPKAPSPPPADDELDFMTELPDIS